MYQVIARKYRPQTFADLIGQEHVKSTLDNAISQRRIAHGYIFAGQRGTGKTTVARIMARCLNCIEGPTAIPCGKCASCLEVSAGNSVDVIEIDAASNRGINEMRELRENVRYRPARDRYKVFIVDEAHQITSEAFNALLKTLEEPPEWVVFILCTTETHKIPTTIASRCQQFSFRSVAFDELVVRMEAICALEGVTAEPEALAVLAQVGEGSVRDSLSALDQAIASCGTTLRTDTVRELLGVFSLDALGFVAQALVQSDARQMLEVAAELERNGQSLQHFCRELARYFRNLLVVKIAGGNSRLVAATPSEQEKLLARAADFSEEDVTRYLQLSLDLFRDLQHSLQPRLHLELGLVRMVQAGKLIRLEDALQRLSDGAEPAARPAKPSAPAAIATSAHSAPVAAPSGKERLDELSRNFAGRPMGFTAPAATPTVEPLSSPVVQPMAPALSARTAQPPASPAAREMGFPAPQAQPAPPARPSVPPAQAPVASPPSIPEPSIEAEPAPTVGAPPVRLRPEAAPMHAAPPEEAAAPKPQSEGEWRSRLFHTMEQLGMRYSADAIERSDITETGNELRITAPRDCRMMLKEADVRKALQTISSQNYRIKIQFGDPAQATAEPVQRMSDDEVTQRALSHPEVQRFQDLFKESQVRQVRNLRP